MCISENNARTTYAIMIFSSHYAGKCLNINLRMWGKTDKYPNNRVFAELMDVQKPLSHLYTRTVYFIACFMILLPCIITLSVMMYCYIKSRAV